MTTERERPKTTGNFNAVFTTILGMALIAVWFYDGMYSSGKAGMLGIIGVVAIVLGIYFQGKPKRRRVRDDE